jgi:hypothetical protein
MKDSPAASICFWLAADHPGIGDHGDFRQVVRGHERLDHQPGSVHK